MHNKTAILSVAFLLWLWGAWNTQQFIEGLGFVGAMGWGLALLFQGALTFLQAPIWIGRAVWYNWMALGVDVFFNVGGLHDPLQNVDNTKSFQAIMSGLHVHVDVGPFAALLLSILVGASIAAMVELLAAQAKGGR